MSTHTTPTLYPRTRAVGTMTASSSSLTTAHPHVHDLAPLCDPPMRTWTLKMRMGSRSDSDHEDEDPISPPSSRQTTHIIVISSRAAIRNTELACKDEDGVATHGSPPSPPRLLALTLEPTIMFAPKSFFDMPSTRASQRHPLRRTGTPSRYSRIRPFAYPFRLSRTYIYRQDCLL